MKARAGIVVAVALAVVAITVWVHWPCGRNQFLDWDDDEYLGFVTQHPRLSLETVRWAFTTAVPFYYQPLTWLSHVADYQLYGLQPRGHHLTNLVLHGLNTALMFLFVWMLGESIPTWGWNERLAAAAGVALVFGIHPLQVESVAWVAERKNVLCGFFFIGSMCAYVRYAQQGQRGGWWWTSMGLGVAALLSKPMAMSLAAVMLALDFFPMRRQLARGWGPLLREKALLIVACVVVAGITFFAQSKSDAVTSLQQLSVGERPLVAVRGMVFYLWKLIWPAWLSPYYPLGDASITQIEFWVPLAIISAIVGVCIWQRRRVPALLAAFFAFVVLILPVSGLFQAGAQAVADRFMYLAMVPLLLLAAGAGVWLWNRFGLLVRAGLTLLLAAEISYFAFRAREQAPIWHDSEVFWTYVLAHFPESAIANLHYARVQVQKSRFDLAVPYALQATRTLPEDARGHSVLGLVYLKTHDFSNAVTELQVTIRLKPDLSGARYNLACAYCRLGRLEDAYETLRELLTVDSRFGQIAARDSELSGLRQSPEYGPKLRELIGPP